MYIEYKDSCVLPSKMSTASTPKVACARALMSGWRAWYIFTMHSTASTYMNAVSAMIAYYVLCHWTQS